MLKNLVYTFFILSFLLFTLATQTFAQENTYNPVVWKTSHAKLAASDFKITIGDRTFLGKNPIRIVSDPGIERTTLETSWYEHGFEMRMFMYFKKEPNGRWKMYDLRTYNAQDRSDWIMYDVEENEVSDVMGENDYHNEIVFTPKDSNINAKVICRECNIRAFEKNNGYYSDGNYNLDFRIGLPEGEIITLTTNPMAGYGVNAVLFDNTGNVVTDQSDFLYIWEATNPVRPVLSVSSSSVPYPDGNCAYGIMAPCPKSNGHLKGINPGYSEVRVSVLSRGSAERIASNVFDVLVYDQNSPVMEPPASTNNETSDNDAVLEQLQELEGEVGELTKKVEQQEEEISALQQIINSITQFLQRLFIGF